MNKLIKALMLLVALAVFTVACREQSTQAQADEQTASKAPDYQAVLGKVLSDEAVINFITSNNCSPAGEFQLCKDAGMALWVDSNQIVKIVYLYSGNLDGFQRYRGKLPFGLTFYDPLWLVEEKLGNLDGDDTTPATSMAGLPDVGSSPDHLHYWAVYKRFGITVIYDSPSADEDAYIYAILVKS